MRTLYTIQLNNKYYQTTSEGNAKDFCARFGAEIVDQEPTFTVIDGVERLDREWWEILASLSSILRRVATGEREQTNFAISGTIREDKTKMDGTCYLSFGPGHLQEFQYPIDGKKPEYYRTGEGPRYRITEWPQDGD